MVSKPQTLRDGDVCVFALWVHQETETGRQMRKVPPPSRLVFVCSEHPNYHSLLS